MIAKTRRATAILLAISATCVAAPAAHASWFSNAVNETRDALAPSQLHQDVDHWKAALRAATAQAAPEATAIQARHYGLHLPAVFDPAKPLVVLVHGLDMETGEWAPMQSLLTNDGEQVATFGYPGDGPIEEDVALLARQLAGLQTAAPQTKINLVAFSMGALVCRGYVEGPLYHGNVDHLILLAPPNHGSSWAKYELLLKARHQYAEYANDPDWHPSWIITDGLGEAGRDLLPDSQFLAELNARPRNAAVHYTIVAGTHHVLRRIGADALDTAVAELPDKWNQYAAVRDCRTAAQVASFTLRTTLGHSDGPVSLASAALPGVSDVVILPVDHETIYLPDGQNPPAAWDTVRARLHE